MIKIDFAPIESATRLRRAANSSRRFASSNTGAGGVMRIAGGSGVLLPATRREGETNMAAVNETATSVNTMRRYLFLISILLTSLDLFMAMVMVADADVVD